MRRIARGVTLVELLIAIAMIGILTGVGFTQFNFAGVATRQAAQAVAASVNRARIEAIRGNSMAGFEAVAANANYPSGYVRVCINVDDSGALACPAPVDPTNVDGDANTVQFIDFASGDLARARVGDTATVFFDRRGVMRTPQVVTVSITDRAGANSRTVTVDPTGRATVE